MVAQALLQPKPLSVIGPKDLNANLVQYAQSDRALNFYAATQAPVTFGAGPSATVVTLGLYNPFVAVPNSNSIMLVIRSIQAALSADPAAATVIFYVKTTNQSTNPTAVTPIAQGSGFNFVSQQYGVNNTYAPVGVPFTAATLPAVPSIVRIGTDVLTTTAPQAAIDDFINGGIILEPGSAFAVQANAAATGYISMMWEEVFIW